MSAKEASKRQPARVLTVTSGKGGVGKTNISINLAIALAQQGKRVILLDLDLGLADVDILLNLSVKADLGSVIRGERKLEEILVRAEGKILVVPGAFGDENMANLGDSARRKLINAIEQMTRYVDYLVIDTGAGLGSNIIDFTANADDVLIVTTPEATSMLDAYAVTKAVHNRNPDTAIHLLINMARDAKEAREAGQRMTSIVDHFLHSPLHKEEFLLYDPVVGDAVRRRQPFLLHKPHAQVSRAIKAIARHLDEMPSVHNSKSHQGFIERLVDRFTTNHKAQVSARIPPKR